MPMWDAETDLSPLRQRGQHPPHARSLPMRAQRQALGSVGRPVGRLGHLSRNDLSNRVPKPMRILSPKTIMK